MASKSSSGSTSLRRKPLAPAAMAPATNSSSSKVVSMMTLVSGLAAMSCFVASIPLSSGIWISMSTMSTGFWCATWVPSATCQLASMSAWELMSRLKPVRTRGWSSARPMVIIVGFLLSQETRCYRFSPAWPHPGRWHAPACPGSHIRGRAGVPEGGSLR